MDPVVKINVTWQKQLFKDVEVLTSEPPSVLKTQLWTLTGVAPDRQTLLGFKGGKLKDDADWSTVGLKPGMKVMMMGTPGEPPKRPDNLDEMIKNEEIKKVSALAGAENGTTGQGAAGNLVATADAASIVAPKGLANLGNTCYMNATLQCLHVVPELREALQKYEGSGALNKPAHNLTTSLRSLYNSLDSGAPDKSTSGSSTIDQNFLEFAMTPSNFLSALRMANPQFAERSNQGMYMQQDAEECWSMLLSSLSMTLPGVSVPSASSSTADVAGISASSSTSGAKDIVSRVDQLFAVDMEYTDVNNEMNAVGDKEEGSQVKEEVSVRNEKVRFLKCHISQSVSHLEQGLKGSMEEYIEKYSETLNRTAQFKRTGRVSRLPPYLTVQFMRFFWKPTEKIKAKILRQVSFPEMLDVYDICTDSLKEKLLPVRQSIEEAKTKAALRNKGEDDVQDNTAMDTSADKNILSECESGYYELDAVLTHQGRAADSGHYVAWVRSKENKWYKFDDDQVTLCTFEEIKKLSGGGDWHMAYILLYRAINKQK